MHFKLERTSCQSLQYISLYNTEGVPFSSEKRDMFLCKLKLYRPLLCPAEIKSKSVTDHQQDTQAVCVRRRAKHDGRK